jgi:hypothetical protein
MSPLQGFINKLGPIPVALPQAIAFRSFGAFQTASKKFEISLFLSLCLCGFDKHFSYLSCYPSDADNLRRHLLPCVRS